MAAKWEWNVGTAAGDKLAGALDAFEAEGWEIFQILAEGAKTRTTGEEQPMYRIIMRQKAKRSAGVIAAVPPAGGTTRSRFRP